MISMRWPFASLVMVVFGMVLSFGVLAEPVSPKIGIVLMHGKGGSPSKHVADLASWLESKGYLVSNLDMPWSGRRDYDVSVNAAEHEVDVALSALRGKGAQKLFVAGHSQGGLFALYFGGRHEVDGVIAIAPGGDVGNAAFREKLGASVDMARRLIADGKGDARALFSDYEGSKGLTPITTTPAIYLSWFDPDGAMSQSAAMTAMNPKIPVLYIGPTGDYPPLRNVKQAMFASLPKHPLTQLHEPDSTHLGAPSASRDEILRWTSVVAGQSNPSPQAVPASARP